MLCKPQIAFLRESIFSVLGVEPSSLFYIGGSDILPPPLEKAEEGAALAALERGDARARSLLIEHNLRLVVKAVNTFDSAKNIKLATYASRCIENEILMFLRKRGAQRSELSFDEPLNTDWDGNELLLSDILGTDGDEVSRPLEDDAEKAMLRAAVSALGEREREIISLRFGLPGGREYTQKEVAEALGISQSYISRLEKRIIERLRREMLRQMQV